MKCLPKTNRDKMGSLRSPTVKHLASPSALCWPPSQFSPGFLPTPFYTEEHHSLIPCPLPSTRPKALSWGREESCEQHRDQADLPCVGRQGDLSIGFEVRESCSAPAQRCERWIPDFLMAEPREWEELCFMEGSGTGQHGTQKASVIV